MRNGYVSQSSGTPNHALEIYLYQGKSKRLSQYSEVAAVRTGVWIWIEATNHKSEVYKDGTRFRLIIIT